MKKSILVFALVMVMSSGTALQTRAEEAAQAPVQEQPAAATDEAGQNAQTETPAPADTSAQDPANCVENVGLEMVLFESIVVVASQKAEPLHEAPVITSVITGEEIKRMGARTLNDVLLTIPGFSHIQDQNEYYSAERGIYASAQQKILVLRDGHRLNSRSYSEANFDYSIGLDNVKRIEILRGPGGSLYGDVALTAVVNIVTEDGKDIKGVRTTLGIGNHLQRKASLVAGKELGADEDITFSASYYENGGEARDWADPRSPATQGSGLVYGFRDLPSYDTYLKYRIKDWTLSGSRRYGHYVEPATGGGLTGQIYNFDGAALFSGESPGLSSGFDHYEVAYTPKIDDWEITGKLYADGFQLRANLALNPTGTQGNLAWKEWNGGAQGQVLKPYTFLGKGNLLAGVQFEHMEVYYSEFATGLWPNLVPAAVPVLKTGKERTYAVFTQIKHYLLDDLIFNFGARYDYRERRPDTGVTNVDQVSPRAAVIYSPFDFLNLRLSYGHSFVDAPYWYRYNTMPSYQGAITLKPEQMDTYQFSIESNLLGNAFTQRLNVYYNDMSDVVFRNLSGVYSNSGIIKTDGLEYEAGYKQSNLSVRANYTLQNTLESNGYLSQDGQLESVPRHMGNLIVDFAPLADIVSWGQELWLNAGLRYVGKQFSRWGKALADPADTVDEALLLNAGFTADRILENVSLGVHGYNLLDRAYCQGGSVEYPYQQPGRWFLAEVTYTW